MENTILTNYAGCDGLLNIAKYKEEPLAKFNAILSSEKLHERYIRRCNNLCKRINRCMPLIMEQTLQEAERNGHPYMHD